MYIATLRWIVVAFFLFWAVSFLIATILGAYDKPSIGLLSSLVSGVISFALIDQFRGQWKQRHSQVIADKKVFWFGVVMVLGAPIGAYNIVLEHMINGSSDFTAERNMSRSAWVGDLYNYLAMKFGAWLPISLNFGFVIIMFLVGVKLVWKRLARKT